MSCAVTMSASEIVRISFGQRDAVLMQQQRERLETLRNWVQGMMGHIAAQGLDEGVLNRACLAGMRISTEAIRVLPKEWSNPFLILLALPRQIEEYDGFMDLRRYFDRVWTDTAKFLDNDDPDGVTA